MKNFVYILLCSVLFFSSGNLAAISECKTTTSSAQTLNQSELTPLDILILDLQEVQGLVEEGNNKTAIVILKSALGNVRKVSEFDKATKKATEKRIKKGIKLLKQNKNQEVLDLLEESFNDLTEAGLLEPDTFG